MSPEQEHHYRGMQNMHRPDVRESTQDWLDRSGHTRDELYPKPLPPRVRLLILCALVSGCWLILGLAAWAIWG